MVTGTNHPAQHILHGYNTPASLWHLRRLALPNAPQERPRGTTVVFSEALVEREENAAKTEIAQVEVTAPFPVICCLPTNDSARFVQEPKADPFAELLEYQEGNRLPSSPVGGGDSTP